MFVNISLIGFLANNFSFRESFLCCGSRVREEGQGQTNNAPWCQPCRKTTTKSDENFNDGISDPQYQQCIMWRDFNCAKHCHDNTRKEKTQLEVVRFWRKLPLDINFFYSYPNTTRGSREQRPRDEVVQHPLHLPRSRRCTLGWIVA